MIEKSKLFNSKNIRNEYYKKIIEDYFCENSKSIFAESLSVVNIDEEEKSITVSINEPALKKSPILESILNDILTEINEFSKTKIFAFKKIELSNKYFKSPRFKITEINNPNIDKDLLEKKARQHFLKKYKHNEDALIEKFYIKKYIDDSIKIINGYKKCKTCDRLAEPGYEICLFCRNKEYNLHFQFAFKMKQKNLTLTYSAINEEYLKQNSSSLFYTAYEEAHDEIIRQYKKDFFDYFNRNKTNYIKLNTNEQIKFRMICQKKYIEYLKAKYEKDDIMEFTEEFIKFENLVKGILK